MQGLAARPHQRGLRHQQAEPQRHRQPVGMVVRRRLVGQPREVARPERQDHRQREGREQPDADVIERRHGSGASHGAARWTDDCGRVCSCGASHLTGGPAYRTAPAGRPRCYSPRHDAQTPRARGDRALRGADGLGPDADAQAARAAQDRAGEGRPPHDLGRGRQRRALRRRPRASSSWTTCSTATTPASSNRSRRVTDKPLKYVINTHQHDDHAGGDFKMLPLAEVIAHKNVRANLKDIKRPYYEDTPGTPIGLPRVTFTDELAVTLGEKEVQAHYFGRGHTSGDAIVYFPELRTIHTGDLFLNFRPGTAPRRDAAPAWGSDLRGLRAGRQLHGVDEDARRRAEARLRHHHSRPRSAGDQSRPRAVQGRPRAMRDAADRR